MTGAVALVRRPRPLLLARRSGTRVTSGYQRFIYQTLLLSAVRSRERGSEDRSGRGGAGRGGRLPLALRRAASQGGLGARAAAFVRVGLAPASVIGVCGGSEVGLWRVWLPVWA